MHRIKVIDPGYSYLVQDFASGEYHQEIKFVKSELKDGAYIVSEDGVTNEAVIKVVLDRLKTLNEKLPSRETSIAITKVEEALLWLEKRTFDRSERGVLGTNNK